MIRALYTLAAPLLGRAGAAVLHAARAESDRADTAEWNEARAIGERDEARRNADQEAHANVQLNAASDRDTQTILDLTAEVERLREVERNGLADDDCAVFSREAIDDAKRDLQRECDVARSLSIRLGQATKERDELQRRRDALSERCSALAADNVDKGETILALETETRQAAEQINAARVRIRELEEQIDARPMVAPVEAEAVKCVWCLEDASEDCFADGTCAYPLCETHYDEPDPSVPAIRARVAARAASCEGRRKSPDPLVVACANCAADVGEACAPRPAESKAPTREAEASGTVDPHCSRCATFGHTFRECMRPAGY